MDAPSDTAEARFAGILRARELATGRAPVRMCPPGLVPSPPFPRPFIPPTPTPTHPTPPTTAAHSPPPSDASNPSSNPPGSRLPGLQQRRGLRVLYPV